MSVDLSVRNPTRSAIAMADSLMKAGGGMAVSLLVAPATGDSSDAGQLGINNPNFQQMTLSPAIFRKVTASIQGQTGKYELLVSASAVAQQVGALQMASADALFDTAAGVQIDGSLYLIEARSVSEVMGQPYLYRLVLLQVTQQSNL